MRWTTMKHGHVLIVLVLVSLYVACLEAFSLPILHSGNQRSVITNKLFLTPGSSLKQPCSSNRRNHDMCTILKQFSDENSNDSSIESSSCFDLEKALFCAGLAFDAYVEPPEDSSRWERGSKGMDVAFVSTAFTRGLYKGLVEVKVVKATGLPDEDDTVESVLSGGGKDACLLVAALEGQWKEDVRLLEKEMYHEGVLDLTGAAHVGKSSTAWSNVDQKKAEAYKRNTGKGKPYHIRSSWGRGGQAIWPDDEQPFYLYVQDPSSVRLIFTLMDDAVVGEGEPIGSTYKKLTSLIPQAGLSQNELVQKLKEEVMEKIQSGDLTEDDLASGGGDIFNNMQQLGYEGTLKLTSKPRIKDKNSQVMMGAMAGAAVAGPVGAAVGGLMGSLYEGEVRGRFDVKLRYLPLPEGANVARNEYTVLGGMPGITWGALYERFLFEKMNNQKVEETGVRDDDGNEDDESEDDEPIATETTRAGLEHIAGGDLEHCFFIKHAETGGCCAVYRSLEKKLIVVSFRGTCEPVDLITDASVIQVPWVNGEDEKDENCAKVHIGFRKSLNSISRRLKELVLASVRPGDDISEYDMLVTGHSLGGALATLFVADIGEYGIDGGRALPQLAPSEAWWKSVASLLSGSGQTSSADASPPRPKTLRMYNFGSPRVGDKVFADRFDALIEDGRIDQAYRVVNGEDIVARLPRTINAIVGRVNYEHVGSTVLVNSGVESDVEGATPPPPLVWIEGETDDSRCPVRDSTKALNNPLSEGILAEIFDATKEARKGQPIEKGIFSQLTSVASTVSGRLQTATVSDLTSLVGIDRSFTDRELKIISSFAKGKALAHHMEDEYYTAMGRAGGFSVKVGEEIEIL